MNMEFDERVGFGNIFSEMDILWGPRTSSFNLFLRANAKLGIILVGQTTHNSIRIHFCFNGAAEVAHSG